MERYPSQYLSRTGIDRAAIDEGLRQHMLRVYNYMASGVALTGAVAYLFASSGLFASIVGTPLMWVVMLAPFAFVLVLSFGIHKLSFGTAQLVYWGYAIAMGLSLASVFMVFTGMSIARVFLITAGTFAAMSLYGYTTKRDLSQMGSFLMMGLIGIIIASLVNIFLASSALHFAISVIGVLVFVGLTAYDTQRIKEEYSESYGHEAVGKLALMGALSLYLDFVNLFMLLLQFFGTQRE